MEIIFWLVIFFLIDTFMCGTFSCMDYIDKYNKKKLILLKKSRFLFVINKKNEKTRNLISIKCMKLQIAHRCVSATLFIVILINFLIIKSQIIFIVCLSLSILYCLLGFILLLIYIFKIQWIL